MFDFFAQVGVKLTETDWITLEKVVNVLADFHDATQELTHAYSCINEV